MSWLNDNGYDSLVRVKQEPNKVDIKKQFKLHPDGFVVDGNGERVEGIEVEFRGDEVVIKPEV
ncbi:Bacteriophage Mu Gam like protein [compost metagenome]